MDGGHIQNIFAVANAEKTGRLLEGFRAEAGDGCELDARAETSMFITVFDDFLRRSFVDSGYIAEQCKRCGVEVYANPVHAGFYGTFKALHQLALIYVVLILADTDGFWINFHKLG